MKLRQTLFWDTNPDKIDLQKNARYVIERVLDFGNDEEVRWMWNLYDKSFIKSIVEKSRCLSLMSRNFWLLMLKDVKSNPKQKIFFNIRWKSIKNFFEKEIPEIMKKLIKLD